jgi:hypothetical protein
MTMRHWLPLIVAIGVLALSGGRGFAICAINAAGLTVTPLTASTGTYTPPTPPTAQPTTFTVSGTYLSLLGGVCTLGIAFHRGSLPATMTISGGGAATLPYTIRTTAGGGTTLLYTGAGTPTVANLLITSFNATLLGVAQPFSINVTAYFLAQPGSPQQAGNYSDGPTLTLNTFNVTIANIVTALTTPAFTVTGIVAKVCTIGGVAHPGADSATIPVSAAGVVNTSPILRSYANAACNAPANVQLTSQSGGVRTSTSMVSGFTNVINYSATGSFSGAIAPINTATNPSASGPESGPAVPTVGTLPSGTLSATITPQATALPLLSGSYSDTLTITITPQ